jgi:hypothetical protein
MRYITIRYNTMQVKRTVAVRRTSFDHFVNDSHYWITCEVETEVAEERTDKEEGERER